MRRSLAAVGLLLFLGAAARADDPFRYPEGRHGRGELKYRNGVPVLTVAGTPEEIGEQIGVLAVKPLAPKIALVKEYVQNFGPAWPVLARICEGLFRRFPPEYRKEVEAMVKAGGVERELLVVANTVGDIQHVGGCSALIVEPARSLTGQVLFGRNSDLHPVGDLGQLGLVIVRRPAGKRAFASVSFPGMLMMGAEMNDAGLVLSGNDVTETKDGSPRLDVTGTPLAVAGRRILEECATVAEAEKLCRGLKATTTGNLVLGDTKGGAVFEVTPKNVRVRRADAGVCCCTNHFRDADLATSTECHRFAALEKYRGRPKLGLADVAAALNDVHQGRATIHSMVFEPAALRIHVAIGPGPVTGRPLRALEFGPLLKGQAEEK
jgi:isopenicillin-N N-acyltransferase like protein